MTLCSAFLDPSGADEETHYLYINDIPGIINHKETSACSVQFSPATGLKNEMTCIQEQELESAISSNNFIPRCRTTNTDLYDGCQCMIDVWGAVPRLGQCFCVDEKGDMLPNTLQFVPKDDSWQRICVEELQCANSDVTYTASSNVIEISQPEEQPQLPEVFMIEQSWTQSIQSMLISLLALSGIVFMTAIYFLVNRTCKSKLQKVSLNKFYAEEQVPMKHDMA